MKSPRQEKKGTGAFEVRVLGCKVNKYEAQQIRRRLELNGMHEAGRDEAAEVVVVHTCAVTQTAVKKSRQTVRQLQRKHPEARVVLTGCAASEQLLSTLEGIHARLGPREGWLRDFESKCQSSFLASEGSSQEGPPNQLPLDEFRGHSRAFLKIQDGCDIGCSFCIVPRLRRAPRDKPLDWILREARNLSAAGHREVVLCGVSVGLYGRENRGPNLAEVIRRIVEVPGIERIRLSSLHPNELTERLLDVWASSPKMMPHFHLPMQAGSNRVLKAMKRNYTASEFLAAVHRVRDRFKNPGINTDVIVGFPTETEDDFEKTVRLSKRVAFSRMHIFPYSKRPHTRAEQFTGQLPADVVKNRCRRLRENAREMSFAYHSGHVGREAMVLAEHWNAATGTYNGYTERYVPVRFAGPSGLTGQIVPVHIQKARANEVEGEWLHLSKRHISDLRVK